MNKRLGSMSWRARCVWRIIGVEVVEKVSCKIANVGRILQVEISEVA